MGRRREDREWRSRAGDGSGRAFQGLQSQAPSCARQSWEFSFVWAEKLGHCSKTQTQIQSCFSEQNKLNWQTQFMLALRISVVYFASREVWQIEASVFFRNSTTSRAWQSLAQTWHEMPVPLTPGVLREGLKQTPDLPWTH